VARVIYVVAIVVGLAFGAGDQYLGTIHSLNALGPWTLSISQMAALWVLLPFLFGCTRDGPREAALVGLIATAAALVGYWAMTVSPMEGVALRSAPSAAVAWLGGNVSVWLAGLVTGPLFGYLGHRWRRDGWWAGPALLSAVFLLEPLARRASNRLLGPSWVWVAEFAVGIGMVVAFAASAPSRRRRRALA
jgi:hypothetical protein